MSSALNKPESLASLLGVGRDYVMAKARDRSWPHVRVGRSVRFTDEQVAQIVALSTVSPSVQQQHADDWGQKTRRAS